LSAKKNFFEDLGDPLKKACPSKNQTKMETRKKKTSKLTPRKKRTKKKKTQDKKKTKKRRHR